MRPGSAETTGDHRTDLSSTGLVSRARERLAQHPHFRGQTAVIAIQTFGDTLVLSGCLPSHYLKQLLQEALKAVPGVANIDNQVNVTWPAP
jgi:osmotically-inducible protein OsmY